jgi:hypothetical protein
MTTLAAWLINKSALSRNGDGDGVDFIATDMVGSSPIKTKFLFTVEFQPRAGTEGVLSMFTRGTDSSNESTKINLGAPEMELIEYDLKTAGRPNPTINYEEINYYGFRTKVATRAAYGTVQLVFYEDALNRANNLLWLYLNTVSPLTRVSITDVANTNFSTEDVEFMRQTISELPNGAADGIFAAMNVHHFYPVESGRGVTRYVYLNPRIESASYDELDMAGSDASTVTIVFNFDGVSVEHGIEPYGDGGETRSFEDTIDQQRAREIRALAKTTIT